jgi:aminoglycoside 6'-N-acetyltransferase
MRSPEHFAAAASTASLRLRVATLADVPTLERWDRMPHVISGVTDDPAAVTAFEGIDWREEIEASSDDSFYLIAETVHDARPIGAMQVADPAREPTHYWGEVEADLRVIDIWIGEPDALNAGWGTKMMRQVIAACFAEPNVDALLIDPLTSNTAAHRFYQRLGFVVEGRRVFHEEDDCLVHRLTRATWVQH